MSEAAYTSYWRAPASAGRAALFVEPRVVDEQGRDVEPGELVEVVYRSPCFPGPSPRTPGTVAPAPATLQDGAYRRPRGLTDRREHRGT